MVQLNLLPDVKVSHIKTQRAKRMVVLGSLIVAAVSIFILIMMFSYRMTQKQHLSNLNKDIKEIRAKLEGNKDLTRMLTVQNQLNSLPALYDGRPAADRLPVFIEQTTPNNVSISKLSLDFSTNTIELTGMAASLSAINTYVDTLKYTSFSFEGGETDPSRAFNDIVLAKHGIDTNRGSSANSGFNASYTISMKFDPQIFDNTRGINLIVPSTVTTHAQDSGGVVLFDIPQELIEGDQ